MKGDFSNYRYRPGINYFSLLKQQGRVDLDSDWNEQVEIADERFRRLVRDLLGEMAVPLAPNEITADNSKALEISDFSSSAGGVVDFSIGRGIAYIEGLPFAIGEDLTFRNQPDFPEPEIGGEGDRILAFIEIWGKTVSYIDDETIRESALGGPDTCLRKKIVGQIKAIFVSGIDSPAQAGEFLRQFRSKDPYLLTLKIDQSAHQIPISFGEVDLGGGLIPGNLHFRIELHRGPQSDGTLGDGFKWSDENAATVVRIVRIVSDDSLIIEESEPVSGESLKEGDCVEISNLITENNRQGGQIACVESITQTDNEVFVKLDMAIHPLLRRFKSGGKTAGGIDLAPRLRRWSGYYSPLNLKTVHDLGRGIKAIFNATRECEFRPGDFWAFALREREYNMKFAPQKAPPEGIRVYRQPLAIIFPGKAGKKTKIVDCRRFFAPLASSRDG